MKLPQQEIDREVERHKTKNYLYFDQSELDIPVYRILPFESLLEMFITNKLTLVKTKIWEDPYENFLLKCNAYDKNHSPINIKELQELIFGQCWTLYPETDAFWRIYSHNINGVKIKSSVRKLFEVIFDNHNLASLTSSFIGKVQYDSQQNIESFFSDPNNVDAVFNDDKSGKGLIYATLIKRAEFAHEKEIRLLYQVDSGSPDRLKNFKSFEISPNDLIDDIVFDPRISERNEYVFRETLLKLGFQNSITKSGLYNFKPINVILPF